MGQEGGRKTKGERESDRKRSNHSKNIHFVWLLCLLICLQTQIHQNRAEEKEKNEKSKNTDNNIPRNVGKKVIQMDQGRRTEREKKIHKHIHTVKDEENIHEIKVSSAQSFLIYFVIVLRHGFI